MARLINGYPALEITIYDLVRSGTIWYRRNVSEFLRAFGSSQHSDHEMPRFARVVVPEICHHVTQRGNARRDVFFTPQDRRVYLGLLKEYAQHYSVQILGYCLMTNHVHLVVVPVNAPGLAKTLREVHGRYARYRNAIDHSSGHVWQGRFYSCPFERLHLPAVMRYVELNPIRARIATSAGDYAWSSAIVHLGGNDELNLLDLDQWRNDWLTEEWASVLSSPDDQGDPIRTATYAGRPFGSDTFVEHLETQLQRRLRPLKAGRPRTDCNVNAA